MTGRGTNQHTPDIWLAGLEAAARAAAASALPYFRPGSQTSAHIRYKNNHSPVTEADLAADAAARAALAQAFPGMPLVSEEDAVRLRTGYDRWLVMDPIDGTRAFVSGRSEWCVSIALIEDGRPVAGVIHAPARAETFGAAHTVGAFLNGARIQRSVSPGGPLTYSAPLRMWDDVARGWPRAEAGETLKALAYRLATVAAGAHDIALATQGAHHWDIAAADIILSEAGCSLTDFEGRSPVYNALQPVHPALVAAERGLARRLLQSIDAGAIATANRNRA